MIILFFVKAMETYLKKNIFCTKHYTGLWVWCFICHTNSVNNTQAKKRVLFVLIYALKNQILEVEWCICRGHALVDAEINIWYFVWAWILEVLVLATLDWLETQETKHLSHSRMLCHQKQRERKTICSPCGIAEQKDKHLKKLTENPRLS